MRQKQNHCLSFGIHEHVDYMTLVLCTATETLVGTQGSQWVSEVKYFKWMNSLRKRGFIEGKMRSVEVKERDESCQKKLNQAEHGNLCHLSHNFHNSALYPLYETTTSSQNIRIE